MCKELTPSKILLSPTPASYSKEIGKGAWTDHGGSCLLVQEGTTSFEREGTADSPSQSGRNEKERKGTNSNRDRWAGIISTVVDVTSQVLQGRVHSIQNN